MFRFINLESRGNVMDDDEQLCVFKVKDVVKDIILVKIIGGMGG